MALPNISTNAALDPLAVAQTARDLKARGEQELHPVASAIADSKARNAPPVRVDPKLIRWSEWGNRLEDRFVGAEFEEFVEDINSTGGNKAPGVVRPLAEADDQGHLYELASGHRRHRACLKSGQKFLCFVKELSDIELQEELESENRNRIDPAFIERAIQYKRQLKSYRSQDHMCEKMRITKSTMSRYLMLADLPDAVLKLISDPLQITLDGGCTFMQFYNKPENKELYEKNLQALMSLKVKLPSKEVFKRLRERPEDEQKKAKVTELNASFTTASGASFGTMTVNRAKQLKMSLDDISPDEFNKIEEFIKKTLKRK
ncbi:ParB/RepB/Spo0J family partition protein [Comamonas thiooxydans]|uniref:ParB/RepB/Spo0J family partition protein n=1 Tax=Comamonas thiooxydans TaxID=363952 RepID=UPI00050EB145|nr:ParB/RepB/Spo0J family partition protein [Comamonas thiooxydans]KGH22998.1 hypothetical protein P606_13270 [Comamonas thiooxydans]